MINVWSPICYSLIVTKLKTKKLKIIAKQTQAKDSVRSRLIWIWTRKQKQKKNRTTNCYVNDNTFTSVFISAYDWWLFIVITNGLGHMFFIGGHTTNFIMRNIIKLLSIRLFAFSRLIHSFIHKRCVLIGQVILRWTLIRNVFACSYRYHAVLLHLYIIGFGAVRKRTLAIIRLLCYCLCCIVNMD